jgi:tRNAThr (cytosine32-N3)-methyltransferase
MFTGRKATAAQHASAQNCTIEKEEEGDDGGHDRDTATTTTEPLEQVIHALSDVKLSDDTISVSEPSTASLNPTPPLPSPKAYPMPEPEIHPNLLALQNSGSLPRFSTEQLGVDRRLLVNRKRQLKMYRVWMQGQFRKLS